MKTRVTLCASIFLAAVQLKAPATAVPIAGLGGSSSPKAIPWDAVGTAVGTQYSGGGLKVMPTDQGARLHCAFQRLDGKATREGLWLTSIAPGQPKDRFCVKAVAVGRRGKADYPVPALAARGGSYLGSDEHLIALPDTGDVLVVGQTVRFTRPGLVEEYTVSMDGVRQDFLMLENARGASVSAGGLASKLTPVTDTELRVELAVTGAQVNQTAHGAQLVLEQSGRKIAYSRLKVTDASGKELPARMEVAEKSEIRNPKSEMRLTVVVDDAEAVYPLRIDPTFSDANWVSLGGIAGANGMVHASVLDGVGNLYIGGEFTLVGDVLATNVAMWNGSTWSCLGSGLSGYPWAVYALAVSGSNVYAGGSFTNAGGAPANAIARWDGLGWSTLGSGMGTTGGNGSALPVVHALAVSGSEVYAGGEFTAAGGIAASNIAKWDGSTWTALGSGLTIEGGGPSTVYALAVSGSSVYAGGYFYTSGGTPANCIAKWDGNAWNALGSGTRGQVLALAVSGNNVYAGGYFSVTGGGIADCIAKWDGSTWSGLDSGITGGIGFYEPAVSALAVLGSDLYAGGSFTMAGGNPASCIARWDGRSWSALGSGAAEGTNGPYASGVYALTVSGSSLYAGGNFTTAGSAAASYVAMWNTNTWSTLGSGMGGPSAFVSVLVLSGTNLYAGGSFVLATDTGMATNIAKWNGSAWSPLGSGLGLGEGDSSMYSSAVYALAVSGAEVYAGGRFANAGDVAVNGIAKWDGNAWSALGSGVGGGNGTYPPAVWALAVLGSEVYAGGDFTTVGSLGANGIAKWNGSSWNTLGSGMGAGFGHSPVVYTLAVSGSNVYAGGWFSTAGGSSATNIAKWDGSTWSPLGLGLGGFAFGPVPPFVNWLAISGSDLYAEGLFATADSQVDYRVAKWNGSTWNALGSGVYGPLVVSGTNLYAGIAEWDGSAWNALGSGLNGGVVALAVSGSDLYLGGNFTTAGGKVSAYVAKLVLGPPPFYFVSTDSSSGLSNGQFYFTLVGPTGSNAVIFASTNLQTWTPLVTNPLIGGSLNFTDTFASNFAGRFYRAMLQP